MKKTVLTILIIIVVLGMVAGYIATGFAPQQYGPTQTEESENTGFGGPTSAPSVVGPTSPPPAAQ